MIDFLNIASVVLALVGMTLPVINIMLSRRNKKRNWGTLSFLSLSSSAISIWLQYILQKLKNILTNDYKEYIIKS